MRVETEQSGGVRVLKPRGPLLRADTDGFSMEFRSAHEASRGRVVLDLGDLHFVDSAGLEAMVVLAEEFGSSAHGMKLAGMNETVREVLDLTGQTEHFELFADVQSAVRSFL